MYFTSPAIGNLPVKSSLAISSAGTNEESETDDSNRLGLLQYEAGSPGEGKYFPKIDNRRGTC